MMSDALEYYKILEVNSGVDENTLKLNYREKAKFWHPDHNTSENAMEIFQKISIAYDVLKNPTLRIVYDLLSLVYTKTEFPDMKNLKIYKAVNGEEIPFLRVFKLRSVSAFKKPNIKEENLIGTYSDAIDFIPKITRDNWLNGWWNPQTFSATINALKSNYYGIDNNHRDNFKLLIHNGAAYLTESKEDKAFLSIVQALDYATEEENYILKSIINNLSPIKANIPQWNFAVLKKCQLTIPLSLVAILTVCTLIMLTALSGIFISKPQNDEISYYQEVQFSSGAETVDDMVVSKIFNIPVDTADETMLYHVVSSIKVMHGPSDNFDMITQAQENQTVRVTGYTPDKIWYRVMLDNGEMGFIKKKYLQKGIGNPIPTNSKIFKGN